MAVVIHPATSDIDRKAIEILVNRDAQGQPDVEFQLAMLLDSRELEPAAKMQPPRSRFAPHPLPDRRRPRRLDAQHANIVKSAPAGEVREQPPNNLDRRFDKRGGTSGKCRRHRTALSNVSQVLFLQRSTSERCPGPHGTRCNEHSAIAV